MGVGFRVEGLNAPDVLGKLPAGVPHRPRLPAVVPEAICSRSNPFLCLFLSAWATDILFPREAHAIETHLTLTGCAKVGAQVYEQLAHQFKCMQEPEWCPTLLYELWSKLLTGGYIEDYIGGYYRGY